MGRSVRKRRTPINSRVMIPSAITSVVRRRSFAIRFCPIFASPISGSLTTKSEGTRSDVWSIEGVVESGLSAAALVAIAAGGVGVVAGVEGWGLLGRRSGKTSLATFHSFQSDRFSCELGVTRYSEIQVRISSSEAGP